jgi:hypothetical protein
VWEEIRTLGLYTTSMVALLDMSFFRGTSPGPYTAASMEVLPSEE